VLDDVVAPKLTPDEALRRVRLWKEQKKEVAA
jgi:hypothetical protein